MATIYENLTDKEYASFLEALNDSENVELGTFEEGFLESQLNHIEKRGLDKV